MMSLFPIWNVQYQSRRPTLTRPLTGADYEIIEVTATNREHAAYLAARRLGPRCRVVAVWMASATGPA